MMLETMVKIMKGTFSHKSLPVIPVLFPGGAGISFCQRLRGQ
jgi:hypothetical protein